MESEKLSESANSSDENEEEITKEINVVSSGGIYENFSNEIFKVSVISYYFYTSVCYLLGSISLTTVYIGYSLRIQEQIACPASSNVYVFTTSWFLIGIIYLVTCFGYAKVVDIKNNTINSNNIPLFFGILGVLCKTMPLIIRVIHIFNFFQIYLIVLDIMILPECNALAFRFIFVIVNILWWTIIFLGVYSKKRIFLPPQLYKPVTNDVGYINYINNLLNSFGL
ncbi:conserved membrane protein, unknown function [Hepatocystis sp. ex Piliocolobus tephrosceles]|nr:conserved membrane protein, unknown function [Hepatocystis sp. ex Piliocolobus tephrosceles]